MPTDSRNPSAPAPHLPIPSLPSAASASHGLAVLDEQGAASVGDIAHPLIRADDLGVLRGEGVFETMRAFGGRAFLLSEHLERMASSADRIDLPLPSATALEDWRTARCEAFGPGDGSLRLVVTKGPEGRRTRPRLRTGRPE